VIVRRGDQLTKLKLVDWLLYLLKLVGWILYLLNVKGGELADYEAGGLDIIPGEC
jgi:hypothetical protein